MCVATGAAELVIAGGAESMSQAEYYSTAARWGARTGDVAFVDRLARGRVTAGGHNYPVAGGMIETAENLRREYGISRARQDAFSLRSHEKAVAAQTAGIFSEEIVPVVVRSRREERVVDTDEHPRPGTTIDALEALRPVRIDIDPEATVTAGNSSGQNDGAAVCAVTTPEHASQLGLRPMARLRAWSVSGVHPARMGIGPVSATEAALRRAELGLDDMDLIELNEAFAAQVLACTTEWGLDDDCERLNVHGSGISLGHPIGATGPRIMTTLLREMDRRDAAFGLETMCIGGGQGIAAVFERVA
jgi:acetyl-CoA C-acetyltransferase